MEWSCPKCGKIDKRFGLHRCINISASESDSIFSEIEEIEVDKSVHPSDKKEQDMSPYYQILELKSGASKEEIMQAFKNLIAVWNPSRFNDDPQLKEKASAKIKELDDAYEKLLMYLATENQQKHKEKLHEKPKLKSTTYTDSSSDLSPNTSQRNSYATSGNVKAVSREPVSGLAWVAIFFLSSFIVYIVETAVIFSGLSQPPVNFLAFAFGYGVGQMPVDLLLGGLVLMVLKFTGVYRQTGVWRFLSISLFIGILPGLLVRQWLVVYPMK